MTKRSGLLSTLALAVAGAVVATLVVSCGIRPSVVIPGQEAPHGTVTSLIVYLLDHNTLRAVNRPLPSPTTNNGATTYFTPYPGSQDALNALMNGPTATEAAGGLTSDLPRDNAFAYMGSAAEGNVYQVFVKLGDGGTLSSHAVDQVVCTVVAAFTSNGIQDSTNIRVQVLDSGKLTRPPQGCPLTP